eukprot:399484-Prorocentrum_minimum.AAC.1
MGGELNSSVVKRLTKGLTGGELNSSVVKRLTKDLTGGELNSPVVKGLIKGLNAARSPTREVDQVHHAEQNLPAPVQSGLLGTPVAFPE